MFYSVEKELVNNIYYIILILIVCNLNFSPYAPILNSSPFRSNLNIANLNVFNY